MAVAIPLIAGGFGAWAGADIGIGAAAGWAIGSSIGSVVEQHFFGMPVPPNALTDLQVQTSSWGVGLPEVFGTQRLAGSIIWSTDKLLVGGQQGKWGGKGGGSGKGAGVGKKGTGSQGYYVVGIAFALCEGPIGGIKRIWAGGDLIFDDSAPVYVPSMDPSVPQGGYQTFTANNQPLVSTGGSSLGTWTLYHGTNEQMPDPTIAANGSANGPEGVPYQLVTLANGFTYSYGSPQYGKMGTACAYRGVAYIVFPALNCGFGGTIPPLTFEVVGQPGTLDAPKVTAGPFSPISSSFINTGLGNKCYGISMPDDETLCIPTGNYVAYCSIQGQLKQYSDCLSWPRISSNYVHTTVQNGSQQVLLANNDNGVRGYNSNMPWTPISTAGVANGGTGDTNNGPGPNYVINGVVYHVDSYYNNIWSPSVYSDAPISGVYYYPVLPWSSPNFDCVGPTCAIGNFIYGAASNPITNVLGAFDTNTQAFSTITLPLNTGASIAQLFTDGNYLYVVDTSAVLYTISIANGVATLITSVSFGSGIANPLFWANGWLYGFSNESSSNWFIVKYNANGSVRYSSTQLPWQPSQFFITSNGILCVNWNGGSTTQGASYCMVSFGDMTLTPIPPTLPTVCAAICARAGFTAVDTSLVPALPVNLTRRAGNSARNVLKVLSQVYQMDMIDSAGTLRFVPKGQNIAAQLGYDDIGFTKPIITGNAPSPYAWSRIQGTDLPRSVALKYTSALANYNTMQQFFQIQDSYGKDVAISVPLTLDDRTALTAAMLLCVEPHIERTGYTWSCSFDWLALEAGDVVQMPWGVTRITQVDIRNAQNEPVLDFQGVIDASYVIYSGQGTAASVPVPQLGQPNVMQTALATGSSGDLITGNQPTSIPGQVPTRPPLNIGIAYAAFVEVPPITSHDTTPAYLVMPWSTGTTFVGAALYESTDGGTTFTQIAQQALSGIVGWTPNVLTATQSYTWDTVSTLAVYLNASYMQLSSATDLQVIQGANLAQIGSELVQFANANLMTDANGNAYYQISRLLRGRRGTESQMGTHVAGESFILIAPVEETSVPYSLSDLNNDAEFKIATVGQNISAIPATDFAPTGLWYKPFSVSHVKVTSDASGDWNVAFTPRARINGWWGSGYSSTLDNDTTTWSADILAGATVKRTLTGVLSTPSFQYTAAMQSADGFTPGQHGIVINIYQVGQLGRGYVNTVTT